MSSSSDATKNKKDAVWQEAGEEFYQESYPSGSGQDNCRQRRSSRHNNIPLPSQTARRNSFALGEFKKWSKSRYGYQIGRRTYGRERISGTSMFTYTSTMAIGTNAKDIHVAVMPDLADMSIPNERKRWEELHKIKSMPIPMAQKRELKAQLTTIPILKLKGWKRFKWKQKRFIDAFSASWAHRMRSFVVWQSSLQDIEIRCGTSIVNVFLFIKWTLFLNIGISAIIISFLILPYFVSRELKESTASCPSDFNSSATISTDMPKAVVAKCCTAEYMINETRSFNIKNLIDRIFNTNTPPFYGYYQPDEIVYPLKYNYAMAYAIVTATIFALCLVLIVRQIGHGIKEMILAGEGEFYKYCNLIFAGWDHYTKDDAGAKFKKKILRHEMKLALKTEKYKFQKSLRSRKQKWKLFGNRLLVNLITVFLQGIFGFMIYYAYDYSIQNETPINSNTQTLKGTVIGFLPSILVTLVNLVFPLFLKHLGKIENYSSEVQTAVILIRALFVRLSSIAFVGYKFYNAQYCPVILGCNICFKMKRKECWESVFAVQIYKIIVIDLVFKIFIVFGVDLIRVGAGHYMPGKIFKKIGTLEFNIVQNSLDIVYIQSLSWLGFYFAPFMPIVVCFYCFIVFYVKKFSVLVICQAVPDTFRTTRTTIIFIATKLISCTVVALVIGVIVGTLEPSKECGPFREYDFPWQVVIQHVRSNSSLIWHQFLEIVVSPGVTTPIAIILFLITYYYYAVAQANRSMVETLRHLLILEGHDKQYLFARLNTLRRQSESSTFRTGTVVGGD